MQKQSTPWYVWAILLGGIWLAAGQPGLNVLPSLNSKATQATYVYEKDTANIPAPVSAGLQELNKQGILAGVFEKDVRSGAGNAPAQFKVAAEAAKELPSLVIQAGDTVLRVVKDPKTKEAVTEAVK